MADVTFPTDATARTPTTLESDDMSFMGFNSLDEPLITDYSDIKSAIETSVAADYLSKTNTTTYTPTTDYHPATKKYVDDEDANFLSKTNTTSYTPTADYHPSTKKYVDDNGGGGGGGYDYILIRDVKTSGTDGGTATSGSYQTRDLNEETYDSGGHASLSSNQVTLAAGTYTFKASAPALRVAEHKIRLYNITASAVVELGTTEKNLGAENITTRSFVSGEFTILSSATFELQHRVGTTKSGDGFGLAVGFGDSEIYSILEFYKTA